MKWFRTACCLVLVGLLLAPNVSAAAPAADASAEPESASGLLKKKRPTADAAKPTEKNAADAADAQAKEKPKTPTKTLPWGTGLDAVRKKAQVDGKPVLVRVGATWCPWCNKLEEVLGGASLQTELDRWALVYVDADESPAEVRQVGAGPIPALRVLDVDGKVVAEKDGFLAEDQLLDWLRISHAKATGRPPGILTADSEELDEVAVEQLIDVLASQNARERETAIRRLLTHRREAALAVCEALAKGRLSTRLAALELLESWQAPIAGLDPWRPETLVAEKHALLAAWAKEAAEHDADPEPKALTAEQLAIAQAELARLLALSDAEAPAAIERLAKFGPALLPETYAQLKQATADRARERLLTLRYRLVASDALILKWPAAASLLASAEIDVRHKAAARLVELATASDQALLLELFSDPDPLVREISLRGLQQVGGEKASEPLVKLLGDPEPSVRAAVLAQLAENPAPALVASVAKYAAAEHDPDLVVHAIRVLKAAGGKPARQALMELLAHESWQARAEAAEALSEIAKNAENESSKADIYVALIDRLEDADSFVVSRAIKGLENANLETAIEPLVKAAKAHPDLAAEAVEALTHGGVRGKSLPHLREFARHADPRVRASAVRGLASDTSSEFEPLVVAGLQDQQSEVRQAAAQALFNNLEQSLEQSLSEQEQVIEQSGGRGLFDSVVDLFTQDPPATKVDQPKPNAAVDEADATDETEKPVEADAADEAEKPEAADKPGENAGKERETPHDLWLAAFQRGRGQPKWVKDAIEPLTQMLQAKSDDERLIAALTLIAVGRIDRGLPVLAQITAAAPAKIEAASAALVWLPWDERIKLFNSWTAKPTKDHSRHAAVMNLAKTHEPRAAETLWGMLDADADIEMVDAVHDALRGMYGLYSYGNPLTKKQRKYADLVVKYGKSGTRSQKVVAMAVLLQAFPDDVAELAQALLDDPQAERTLRKDALQFLLLSQSRSKAEKLAIERLAAPDPEQRKLALSFLARGPEALQQLNDQMYLQPPFRNDYDSFGGRSGEKVEVTPPTGLTVEMVEPLLKDADSDVAAYAGYLLATLGDEKGLPPLMEKWRAKGRVDNWSKLMYRAITALDDDTKTPILEEIAAKLRKYDKRDFYWTIRSIEGPQALKLRKKIRDEVGMDNLR